MVWILAVVSTWVLVSSPVFSALLMAATLSLVTPVTPASVYCEGVSCAALLSWVAFWMASSACALGLAGAALEPPPPPRLAAPSAKAPMRPPVDMPAAAPTNELAALTVADAAAAVAMTGMHMAEAVPGSQMVASPEASAPTGASEATCE